jgi:hypothetical protein
LRQGLLYERQSGREQVLQEYLPVGSH